MPRKRLKMTKKCIAARRRYKKKKRGAGFGFGPRSTTGFQSQSFGSRDKLMRIIRNAK